MSDKLIKAIIQRKKEGTDCTETESAEIKGWLRETTIFLQSDDIEMLEEIQLLFPIEYGEWTEEDEKANF